MLIKNIKQLVQVEDSPYVKLKRGVEMSQLNTIEDAFLIINDGRIASFGQMTELHKYEHNLNMGQRIDASGKMIFPSFVDSHTHLVYPDSREIEYIDEIKGLSYEEIAKRGGGILNSSKKMQAI